MRHLLHAASRYVGKLEEGEDMTIFVRNMFSRRDRYISTRAQGEDLRV